MKRIVAISLCSILLGQGAQALALEPTYKVLWSMSSGAGWPPALEGDRMVLRKGSSLECYSLADGKQLWKKPVSGLLAGPRVMAARDGLLLALGKKGLHVLSMEDGKPVTLRKLSRPRSLLSVPGGIYVSTDKEVLRLDDSGKNVLSRYAGIGGDLEAASGEHVVLDTRRKDPKLKVAVERLEVINLTESKELYQFKLLPRGGHQVVLFDDKRLIFIDYSKKLAKEENPRKLYFTEVDYRNQRKLRDLSLSDKYAAEESDQMWVTVGPQGAVYLSNHGKPGDPSALLAYDPLRKKTLWERAGETASMGALMHQGILWSVTAGSEKGGGRLTAYAPANGDTMFRVELDSPGLGRPLVHQGLMLVRTRKSVFCMAPVQPTDAAAVAAAGPPAAPEATGAKEPAAEARPEAGAKEPAAGVEPEAGSREPAIGEKQPAPGVKGHPRAGADQPPPPPATDEATGGAPTMQPIPGRPGWQIYSDPSIGFSVQMPDTWQLDSDHLRRMQGVRAVIPFARTKKAMGRTFYLGTLQVLTWEAAGRDADGLWKSVHAQRKGLSPDMKVLRVYRLLNVGGLGVGGVLADYEFSTAKDQKVRLRSICVVSHDVAFELRAWASPLRPRVLWREIEQITAGFVPGR